MKPRILSIGLAVVSAALVACGGGGGGGGGNGGPPPTNPPTATPTATPTAPPTPFGCAGATPLVVTRTSNVAPRPIGAGDSFTYTGSYAQTFVQDAPCAEPTATSDASVTVGVSDAATTAPNGNPGTASTSTETDSFPTYASTTITSQILQINNSNQLLLFSSDANDGTGDSLQTTYNNPQEIDDLGGGTTWTNNPAATINETLADGTKIARTLAADGSYGETETYADGSKSTIAMNGASDGKAIDGSGTYAIPGVTFAYAAPSGGNITLTITSSSGSKIRTFPAWFTVPPAYVTDSFADNGSKPFDTSCSVPSSIGTAGRQVVETYDVLDPVLGYTETRTVTSYDVDGYGPACVVIADTLNAYYDYADNTTRIDYQSTNGQPVSVNTIAETLSMQSAACGGGSPPCAQARRANARPVSPVAVAARVAAIDYVRAKQRAERIQALHDFALRFAHRGGVR
jgi:hypothetical protein